MVTLLVLLHFMKSAIEPCSREDSKGNAITLTGKDLTEIRKLSQRSEPTSPPKYGWGRGILLQSSHQQV